MPDKAINRGDIVLVPFPFTNQSGSKVRPAVVVSPDPWSSDIIIAFISSVLPKGEPAKTELVLLPENPSFPLTGLRRPSVFKMAKLLTINRSLIKSRLGRVPQDLQARLDECLKHALGIYN